MDRFSVTAIPATGLPGTALQASQPQGSQQGPSSTLHQSQRQLEMQLPHAGDDSAHDPRRLGGARLGSGLAEEEAEGPSARPDLAALRGRDDSARGMPVLQHYDLQFLWQSSLRQKPRSVYSSCAACDLCVQDHTHRHCNKPGVVSTCEHRQRQYKNCSEIKSWKRITDHDREGLYRRRQCKRVGICMHLHISIFRLPHNTFRLQIGS